MWHILWQKAGRHLKKRPRCNWSVSGLMSVFLPNRGKWALGLMLIGAFCPCVWICTQHGSFRGRRRSIIVVSTGFPPSLRATYRIFIVIIWMVPICLQYEPGLKVWAFCITKITAIKWPQLWEKSHVQKYVQIHPSPSFPLNLLSSHLHPCLLISPSPPPFLASINAVIALCFIGAPWLHLCSGSATNSHDCREANSLFGPIFNVSILLKRSIVRHMAEQSPASQTFIYKLTSLWVTGWKIQEIGQNIAFASVTNSPVR